MDVNGDFLLCRAEIISAIPDPSAQFAPEARVLLLDEGRVVKVKTSHLFGLPRESDLETFPPEIVEVSLFYLYYYKIMTIILEW